MPVTTKTPTMAKGTLAPRSFQVEAGGAPNLATNSTGNLGVQVLNPGAGNAADTTDDVLMVFSLPAAAFDAAYRQLTIQAAGSLAANSNSKRVKLWWGPTKAVVGQAIVGGTVIADTGASTASGVGWNLQAQVTKYGAFTSNTQVSQGEPIIGTTHGGVTAPTFLTANESAPILIAVTGSSAASAASDVLANLLDISWAN